MRAWMDQGQFGDQSSFVSQLISGMSRAVEKYLGRYLESTSRTTYIDVEPGECVFFLQGYPISSSGLSIYEDTSRLFTGSALDSTMYDTTARALNEGRIEFDSSPTSGPSVLKVVYTGGLATSVDNLVASTSVYLDLVHACERQIWFWNTHRGMLGLDGHGGGQVASDARREVMLLTWWEKHGDFLPEVVSMLRPYKSVVPRW